MAAVSASSNPFLRKTIKGDPSIFSTKKKKKKKIKEK
jgi:hypothetical protein